MKKYQVMGRLVSVAMRGLKDPDSFLETDLIVKRAINGRNLEHLRPWRAYANMYIWRNSGNNLSEKN